jgi:predicted ATPase
VTGGPCAGKTTALTELSFKLTQKGFRVLLVPEAAKVLKKGSALASTSNMTFGEAVKFQMNVMKLQMALEDIFIEIAQTSEKHTILLFNRGVMDGAAYTDENVWQAILDEMGWSTI